MICAPCPISSRTRVEHRLGVDRAAQLAPPHSPPRRCRPPCRADQPAERRRAVRRIERGLGAGGDDQADACALLLHQEVGADRGRQAGDRVRRRNSSSARSNRRLPKRMHSRKPSVTSCGVVSTLAVFTSSPLVKNPSVNVPPISTSRLIHSASDQAGASACRHACTVSGAVPASTSWRDRASRARRLPPPDPSPASGEGARHQLAGTPPSPPASASRRSPPVTRSATASRARRADRGRPAAPASRSIRRD